MENMHDVGFFNNPNFGVDDDKVDEEVEVLEEEPKKKRQRKGKAKQVKVEDDDSNHNWLDNEVETLIALKGEMQPDFIKNAKNKVRKYVLCNLGFEVNFVFWNSGSIASLLFHLNWWEGIDFVLVVGESLMRECVGVQSGTLVENKDCGFS